uniref:Uncharacterized protein n=1 Tax=Anguilla anguilla TaxID=7936 RepID=A0A0E9Q3M4_ANGAN
MWEMSRVSQSGAGCTSCA